jgi:FkbH-like protein
MQIRLTDRFGDNGIISIIILLPTDENETYEIDSWIMSCRVIGRRVEEAALNILVRTIKSRGGAKLIGRYRPSAKNSLVKDHYKKLGFDPAQSEGDDQLCQLLLTDYVAPDNLPFNFNNI